MCYSIFSILYKGGELNKVNTFFKGTMGIGNILGLAIGMGLYTIGGYSMPFVVYGTIYLAFAPFTLFAIPSNIDYRRAEEIHSIEESGLDTPSREQ